MGDNFCIKALVSKDVEEKADTSKPRDSNPTLATSASVKLFPVSESKFSHL